MEATEKQKILDALSTLNDLKIDRSNLNYIISYKAKKKCTFAEIFELLTKFVKYMSLEQLTEYLRTNLEPSYQRLYKALKGFPYEYLLVVNYYGIDTLDEGLTGEHIDWKEIAESYKVNGNIFAPEINIFLMFPDLDYKFLEKYNLKGAYNINATNTNEVKGIVEGIEKLSKKHKK